MSTNRYLLGSRGICTYGVEGTPYTVASDPTTEFGFITDEVEPPNPNPHTAMPTAGHDGPYVNSPDQKEYEFDVTVIPTNEQVPVETALGSRTMTENLEDGYEAYTFTEERPLETMTVRHVQEDADMVARYVGSKSNLSISASQDEPVEFDFSVTSAKMEYDDTEAAPSVSASLPQDQSPYRFHMLGSVTLSNPSDDSLIKEVATITDVDFNWDNGLEVNHHGQADAGDSEEGRDAYSVSEETNAERYDMSMDIKVEDKELYTRAANNDAAVDIEVPFTRQSASGVITDGIIIRMSDCTITDAPIPNNPEGSIDGSVKFMPLSTELEIRTPL